MNEKTKYNEAAAWQVALFALCNCATNIALFLMNQYSYYTQNVVGLAASIIGIIGMCTRLFDAVTDPLIGLLVDKTNGRFGKLRPFMLIGNIVIWIGLIGIFNTPTNISIPARYVYNVVFYCLYILGYTCQGVAYKAGQTVLTNNPKKRSFFVGFDGVFTQLANTGVPLLLTNVLAIKYSVGEYANNAGMINPAMWSEGVRILAVISFALTILAIIGISEKDRPENFAQLATSQKVGLKDYWSIIKGNRPMQMLIVAASTDKLGLFLMNGTMTYVFANLLLNNTLRGTYSSLLLLPLIALSFVGVMFARKFGLKKGMLMGTWGSMILLLIMFLVRPNPSMPYIFIVLMLVQKCMSSLASASIYPMIADCTDYENYLHNRYVPGMMGTIYSFVDKVISSFSSLIQGFALTLAGVGNVIITPNEPVNDTFNTAILICFCIVPFLGHVATVIAMKFYTLDAAKMEEVQAALSERTEQQTA